MPSDRRWVKVDAVVRVPETDDLEDAAQAYEAVARVLVRRAADLRAGKKSSLFAMKEPLLRFAADSGPGSAP